MVAHDLLNAILIAVRLPWEAVFTRNELTTAKTPEIPRNLAVNLSLEASSDNPRIF